VQHSAPYRPTWVHTTQIRTKGTGPDVPYCVIHHLPPLIRSANLAPPELHTGLPRLDDLRRRPRPAFQRDPRPPAPPVDRAPAPRRSAVCVSLLRGRPRPTVSTPITWDEVKEMLAARDPTRLVFEPEQVLERVQHMGDLYAPVLDLEQRLPPIEEPAR